MMRKNYVGFLAFALIGLFCFGVAFAQTTYAPSYVASVRTLYSPTPVGSVTPVAIVSSLPGDCSAVDIFDTSGATLELMTGASTYEVRKYIVPPGGTGRVGLHLFQGDRVSLRTLSTAVSAGEDDFTCVAE